MRSLNNSFDAGNMPVHQYQLKVFCFQKRKCLLEHKVRNEASSLARLSKICFIDATGTFKSGREEIGPSEYNRTIRRNSTEETASKCWLRENAMGVFRILSESALHEAWG